jgi:hypothetical protein
MDTPTQTPVDVREFLETFHDYLAPKLDTYEQAIYLYIFRHSRLIGIEEVTIGFKSARSRLAAGIGEDGKPMSEGTAYKKVASLQAKGCLTVVRTTHAGRLIRLHLPIEIPGVVVTKEPTEPQTLEEMDFFDVPENRDRLLRREGHRCFYTLKELTNDSFIVEHVVSRPVGDNSYRNCVAASREANNRKGALPAEDFLRRLYREGFLSETEFENRKQALKDLLDGRLVPPLD